MTKSKINQWGDDDTYSTSPKDKFFGSSELPGLVDGGGLNGQAPTKRTRYIHQIHHACPAGWDEMNQTREEVSFTKGANARRHGREGGATGPVNDTLPETAPEAYTLVVRERSLQVAHVQTHLLGLDVVTDRYFWSTKILH